MAGIILWPAIHSVAQRQASWRIPLIPFNPFTIPQLPLFYVLVLAFLATTALSPTPVVLQDGVLGGVFMPSGTMCLPGP